MATLSDLRGCAQLLRMLRLNANHQVGLLSVECLLLVSGGPKTSAEMAVVTGAFAESVVKACWPFLTRVKVTGEVVPAQIPLMKRVKRAKKPPTYHLSVNGWRLLHECGLL